MVHIVIYTEGDEGGWSSRTWGIEEGFSDQAVLDVDLANRSTRKAHSREKGQCVQ